ncbi:MAG: hypothetical protein IJP03_02760, partial [Christensenellaceae bacterium]|nr:hypothetical protein [Christensenellaceae bacterium]
MKCGRFLFTSCSVLVFLLILLFPSAALKGAAEALRSFGTIVLPSLFPFMVATSLLASCGVVDLIAGFLQPLCRKVFGFSGYFAYVFLSAALGGYPVGAR